MDSGIYTCRIMDRETGRYYMPQWAGGSWTIGWVEQADAQRYQRCWDDAELDLELTAALTRDCEYLAESGYRNLLVERDCAR